MPPSALDRARAGDERAFGELTEPYRRELLLHCYRMLGSLADAEDVVQDVLVAAWRAIAGFEGRASVRTWLYRIATNRCLNAIRAGRRRPPPEPLPPFVPPAPSRRGEVTWLSPYPDAWLEPASGPPERRSIDREAVTLAFVTALQRLPPRQCAALVLANVLDFTDPEVATMLGTSPTAVKGLRQRARAAVGGPGGANGAPAGASPPEAALARRFAAAYTADDIDGVVMLLTDDAWLAMPPAPHEYHGGDAIAAFLRASASWRQGRKLHLVATGANGQPAFGVYLTAPGGGVAHSIGMIVLTVRGDGIAGVTRFLDADLPRRLGLAPALG